MTERIEAWLRMRDARRFRADAESAATGVRNIGREARQSSMAAGALSRTTSAAGSALGGLARGAAYGASALGAVGVAAGVAGIRFNANMESNTVAFSNFLGSTDKATAHLEDLYKLSSTTPFEFADITGASRKLLAFGQTAEESNGWLATIGDTVSGIGGGTEEINRMVGAIGQIQAKGKASTEEMLQLAELGIPAFEALAKGTGRSMGQVFEDLSDGNIKSKEALDALQKQLGDTFGGASAKQAKTFNGQISTLKDNISLTLGQVTLPLFNELRTTVLPAVNSAMGAVGETFKRTDLSMEQKVRMARRQLVRGLGPLVSEGIAALEAAGIGPMIGDALASAIDWAVPQAMKAAERAAPQVAGAFVAGFRELGPWGKLFTIGLLAGKLGVFTALGAMASRRFVPSFAEATGAKIGPATATKSSSGLLAFAKAAGKLVGPVFALWALQDFLEGKDAAVRPAGNELSGSPGGGGQQLTPEMKDDVNKRYPGTFPSRDRPGGGGGGHPSTARTSKAVARTSANSAGLSRNVHLALEVPVTMNRRELGRAFAEEVVSVREQG